MEETTQRSRSIDQLMVLNDQFDNEAVILEEVRAYIEGVYDDIMEVYKSKEVSFHSFRQFKETDICVDLSCEIKLLEDSKIEQNLFIGSNPGLFYSENSGFQQDNHGCQLNSESASISKLTSFDPTQKNTPRDNLIKDSSLQISGDTIFDITDCQDASQNKTHQQIQQKQTQQPTITPVKIIEETSRKIDQKSFFQIPQNKPSRHSKYCDAVLSPKKKRDFVVPVIHNDRFKKKSREQYFLINDKNLTNFFVTKNKSNFVHKLGNDEHSRVKDNNFDFQKSSVKEENNSNNTFQRSNIKRFVNTNRESFSSNYNSKLNSFNSRDQDDFVSPNVTNTKFMIKMLPSDKTKKLFNQSTSTFINHNYRPITCRKQFRKPQQSQTYNKQVNHELVDYSGNQSSQKVMRKDLDFDDEKENKMIKRNISCDLIAIKNSFRNITSNTKKGKTLKTSRSERNFKSSFFRQKDSKLLVNFEKIAQKLEILQKQKEKENPVSQSFSKCQAKNQSASQITLSTNSQQKRFKNFTEFQLEIMKNNNIKRVKKFKQVANSKLDIVSKMGVKIVPD